MRSHSFGNILKLEGFQNRSCDRSLWTKEKRAWRDSNPQHSVPKTDALSVELQAHGELVGLEPIDAHSAIVEDIRRGASVLRITFTMDYSIFYFVSKCESQTVMIGQEMIDSLPMRFKCEI